MKPTEPGLQASNDAEIARRALKLLAERRLIPTPETFADAFLECAGHEGRNHGAAGTLKDMTADLVRQSRMSQQEAAQVLHAVQKHHWTAVRDSIDRSLARRVGSQADSWPTMALALLKQSDALHPNWTRARKLEAIGRVLDAAAGDPAISLERLSRLVESWGPALTPLAGAGAATAAQAAGAAATATAAAAAAASAAAVEAAALRTEAAAQRSDAVAARNAARQDDLEAALAAANQQADAWKRMAMRGLRALEHSCLPGASAQEKLREFIAQAGRDEPDAVVRLASRFIDVVGAIDREIEEEQRIREGLQRLLALLCDNVRQLAPDEVWLAGQLEPIRALLAGPIRSAQIAVAESRLAALIAQQTTARKGLKEAKIALTEMLTTLLDRVGAMDSSAECFSETVSSFQAELTGLDDASAVARIIEGLLAATSTVRNQIDASRADLVEARKKVEAYEARVSELEQQLSQVSTLVQKDPLTNALNRRGLEQAFQVESARAARYGTPLTLALMDLDDFKKVNDTLGHVAGDRALIHFVTTVHATMRPTDLTARAGGEEFSVLFPATDLKAAAEAVERLQRELAQRPFAFENERMLLSFSSGVAQWQPGESLEDLMKRSDAGLYEAKRSGKNRVVRVKVRPPGPPKEPAGSG